MGILKKCVALTSKKKPFAFTHAFVGWVGIVCSPEVACSRVSMQGLQLPYAARDLPKAAHRLSCGYVYM